MFLTRLNDFLSPSKRRAKEGGASDLVVTVLIIIIPVSLLLATINVSNYFGIRSSVQDAARTGARQVSLYGGNSGTLPLNTERRDVSLQVLDRIWSNGKCTLSACSAPPVVSCSPARAVNPGEDVWCQIRYFYTPVATDIFGFDGLTSAPYTVREVFVSETGYRG